MLIVFTVTVFLAAALLFLLQPMFARMLLPMLGGSPAVWNTAMMFYQTALLTGYALAHFTKRRHVWAYVGLALLSLIVLPVAVPRGWLPPTQSNPIPWLLGTMLVSVGLPFIVIAAASPMLQRWFAARSGKDPYWLYAASNLGSLLALIAYPALIEPRLGLAQQSRWWSVGFAALVALLAVCVLWSRSDAAPVSENVPVPFRRRLRWLLLAFAPCSLMLSATTYLTSSVAPIPLLWVVPLATYLLTFVLVFAKRRLLPHKLMLWTLPLALLAMPWTIAGLLLGLPMEPLDVHVVLHVAVLFVVAMVCHGELANDRPPASQLTEFYLWLAIGGALGGVFNALLAPLLFPTVWEYPLTLLLACLLVRCKSWRGYVAGPVLLGLATVALLVYFSHRSGAGSFRTVRRARSFFGIHQVFADESGNYHFLKHGCTVHGVQNQSNRREPLSYFSRRGPLGEVMATVPPALKQQVAVVGLGAGTVACYGEQGQQWTFYEIDPVVEQIARDPRCFTFLADCPASVKVVLGDARLSLEREPDGRFGVMILDPYNSDTPPLHLLTREALALYQRKLAPQGVMAFHISASHLELKPVLANLARDAHLFALHLIDFSNAERRARGESLSRWVVMTRHPPVLERLANSGYWRMLRPNERVGVWTDDYVSLFRVWSWDL
jgi:hypothetical protein